MDKFLQEVMRLDALGDHYGIVRLAAAERDSHLPWTIYQMLNQHRFFEAYMGAKLFIGTHSSNPVAHLAEALGGLLFGNADDLRNGVARLRDVVDRLPPEQQEMLATGVVQPAIKHVVMSNTTGMVHDHDVALSILDILVAGQPGFRRTFDTQSEPAPLDWQILIREGRERARLLTFPTPPAGEPHCARRAVVAVRELVFPQYPDSRLLDVGPRIGAAMQAYGWQPTACPMHFRDLIADFRSLVECCEREQAELLILDDYYILAAHAHVFRADMLASLRARLPGIRIVALHLDPWEVPPAILVSTVTSVDFVWTTFPSMQVWNEPVFAGKLIQIPLPNLGAAAMPITPLSGEMTFTGSIAGYNWHRLFWMAAAKRHGLPVRLQLSSHRSDGLSVIDSYQAYIRSIEASGCALNFSMRPDQSRVITGRTFEAILAGALLVQESNPDMDYYFVSGEHYLSFSTFPDLRAIVRFVAAHLEDAENIRRSGNAHAKATYSDDKLIGHLDRRLFFAG
jgi:hypothetical protein